MASTKPQNEEHVVHEIRDNVDYGDLLGNVKWFNKKLGYGFITIYTGDHRGENIFVHHTGIKPLNSLFKTLRKGEYVNLRVVTGENGYQAIDVTGVMGGPLMCDNVEFSKNNEPTHKRINPKSE